MEKDDVAIALWFCVKMVPGLNLDWDIVCID